MLVGWWAVGRPELDWPYKERRAGQVEPEVLQVWESKISRWRNAGQATEQIMSQPLGWP